MRTINRFGDRAALEIIEAAETDMMRADLYAHSTSAFLTLAHAWDYCQARIDEASILQLANCQTSDVIERFEGGVTC